MLDLERDPAEYAVDYLKHRWYGKYRGLVKDNDDPTHRGRLLVRVESVLRDQEMWAEIAAPFGGKNKGLYALPEKDDGVWVEFEEGDSSLPIVTGFIWASDQLPKDQDGKAATPPVKILRSRDGLMASLDDDKHTITISDQNGKNFLKISADQGVIKVQSTQNVTVEAPMINLVENSTHPLVFGDELMKYLNQLVMLFNAHLHPGELALGVFPVTPAPPVAPFTPPDPGLISTKVKTG